MLFVGAGLVLVVGLVITVVRLLSTEGWSKDVVFDDGQMGMRMQFKVEPDPSRSGAITLMARVKELVGYPMRIDHVHFAISQNGQNVRETMEGDPFGNFIPAGDGYYATSTELPSPEDYQVDLLVQHNQSSFKSTWPLESK